MGGEFSNDDDINQVVLVSSWMTLVGKYLRLDEVIARQYKELNGLGGFILWWLSDSKRYNCLKKVKYLLVCVLNC